MLHQNQQLQEKMLQLQDACNSALALEKNAKSYSVGHRAREQAFRVAAGAYDIILLQIDDIRSSLFCTSTHKDSKEDDDDDAFIVEDKTRVLKYLCGVSSAYRQHAALFKEKMRSEERMNQNQTSM